MKKIFKKTSILLVAIMILSSIVTLATDNFKDMDFNNDYRIDEKDLQSISSKLNTKIGDNNWDIKYDVNKDEIIDIYDVVKVGYDYGEAIVIVIDPGHGGSDPGAIATHNGLKYEEATYNLQISLKLKSELEKAGYTVAMTVDPIKFLSKVTATVSLESRATFANLLNADLFISIHQNSATASATGVEVWYSSDNNREGDFKPGAGQKSKVLANDMSSNISTDVELVNRKGKDGRLYVTRKTLMTSVLVECGFITNSSDIRKIADSSSQQKIVGAITKSVKKYFNS